VYAAAAAAAALAVALVVSGAASGAGPRSVDRVRIPAVPDPGYPSPFMYNGGPGFGMVNWQFDTLLWKDARGTPIPWLARSWSRSRDGLSYRFRLRSGIRWHDGRPLTARDVVFTFEYMRNGTGKTAPRVFTPPLDSIAEVRAPNASTVVFRLARRYAPFPEAIAGRVAIIPQHIWADVSDPARFRDPRALIGTGPYRLGQYDEAAGSYRFEAYRSYFLGVPYVRSLEYVPVSRLTGRLNVVADELRALERGVTDGGGLISSDELVPRSAFPFDNPRFGHIQAPGEWNRALFFNLAKGFPYDERRFRTAVAHAVNRFGLIRRILFGLGRPGSYGLLAPANEWTPKGLPSYAYSPATARGLLEAIGLRDRDGDGLRDLPDGKAFRPELLTSTRYSPKTAELVEAYLHNVGIELTIRSLDSNAADAATAQGRYDLALIGHGAIGGDPDFLRLLLSARVASRSPIRVHGYGNARFEELADAQLVTVKASKRREQVFEMQRLVARDVPVIPLYVPPRIYFYAKRVSSVFYWTPGGVGGVISPPFNKHAFITGRTVGLGAK
jgi:peptide/nickel transport system substrate-binding protein